MSAASNDNTNQISHSSAREVGWAFVREYYKYFHENPDILHCFYSKQSRVVRGLEGEEVKVCHGLQEIKKSIAEMCLKDAVVNITNVDSLDSFDNKVIVQVTGRFFNKGGYKRFVQTVILDTQLGGYYVSSDIFRYMKDETDEIIRQQPIERESAYTEDGVSSIIEEKLNGEDSVSTLSTEESTQEINKDSRAGDEVTSDITAREVSMIPSLPKSEVEDITSHATEENAPDDELSKPADSGQIEKGSTIIVQTEKVSSTTSQLTSPTQSSPSKSQPSSWVTVASSDSAKWSTSTLAENKGRVVSSQLTRTQSQTSSTREPQKDRNANRDFSLYVKVVNDRMTYEVLHNAFKSIGNVKHLDVVPAKSCAFVEFSTQEAYQQALSQRHIPVPGFRNETVTVEERRKADDNSRHRSRQNYDNYRNYGQASQNPHNGMSTQRGGRGSERRMVTRPPAKSPS